MLIAHRLSCLRNNQALFSALDFTLSPGEILHITGPNGSGKSTLLNVLTGLFSSYQGEICWQGLPITNPDSNYYSQLTYIGHKIGVKNRLTVLENLQIAATLQSNITVNWTTILQRMLLEKLKHTLCQHLSAGQRQRVALARLLLTNANVWILDEPFTGLDIETTHILKTILEEHCTRGGMVILTSHHDLEWNHCVVQQLAL